MERNVHMNQSMETLIRRRHLHLRIIVTCIEARKGGFVRFITCHNYSDVTERASKREHAFLSVTPLELSRYLIYFAIWKNT